jgi:hypothetical protein
MIGGQPYSLDHNLNSTDLIVQCKNLDTGELEEIAIDIVDEWTIELSATVDRRYRVQIFAFTTSLLRGWVENIELIGGVPYTLEHPLNTTDLIIQCKNRDNGQIEGLQVDVDEPDRIVLTGNVDRPYRIQMIGL